MKLRIPTPDDVLTRVARLTAASYYAQCPNCDTDLPAPSGSLMWVPNESNPVVVVCPGCGKAVPLPKALAGLNKEGGK